VLPRNLNLKIGAKRASVLIPLCNRNGEASILFNVRSNLVSNHKGEVSFPGGHLNEGENDEQCALRETLEELGANIGNITTLGVFQTIPAITGTIVTPVLAFLENDIKDFEDFSPNKDEVAKVFTRSITELTSADYRSFKIYNRGGEITMPLFGPPNEEQIWGLTAFILNSILHDVIIPNKPM
jgi:nudix motif 8